MRTSTTRRPSHRLAVLLAALLLWTGAPPGWSSQDGGESPAGRTCDACTIERGRARLCEPHAKEEAEVFKATRKARRSKRADERGEGLEQVAALTLKHVNAPSHKVAVTLAKGLDDKTDYVRSRAVKLLSQGQELETAVPAVIDALKGAERGYAKFEAVLRDFAEEHEKGTARLRSKASEEFSERLPALGYLTQTLDALGRMPDERCVSALVGVLQRFEERSPQLIVLSAGISLIELGSRTSVGALIDYLVELERLIEDDDLKNPFGVEKAPRNAGGAIMVTVFPAREENWETLAQRLADAALAQGASDVPATELGTGHAWRAWFDAHPELFTRALATD